MRGKRERGKRERGERRGRKRIDGERKKKRGENKGRRKEEKERKSNNEKYTKIKRLQSAEESGLHQIGLHGVSCPRKKFQLF